MLDTINKIQISARDSFLAKTSKQTGSFVFSNEMLDLLRSYSSYVRTVQQDRYLDHREDGDTCDPILREGVLLDRLDLVRRNEMFLDPTAGPKVGLERIIKMMSHTAVQALGLAYDKKGTKNWAEADLLHDVTEVRAKGFFDAILYAATENSSDEEQCRPIRRKSLPKADLALLALAFGTPPAIWEVEDSRVFEAYVKHEAGRRRGEVVGKPLLAYSDFDYLSEHAVETSDFELLREEEVQAGAQRGVVGRAYVRKLQKGKNLAVRMPLPNVAEVADCLLFVREPNGALTLLNCHEFSHRGGIRSKNAFMFPKDLRDEIKLTELGPTDLFLVMETNPKNADSTVESHGLKRAACYLTTENKTGETSFPDVSAADLQDLRRRFLNCRHGTASVYRMHFHVV